MRATVILPVLAVVAVCAALGADATSRAATGPHGAGQSLQEAATQPYGTTIAPGAVAAAVNAGRQKQAANIPMKKVTQQQGSAAAEKQLTDSALTAGCTIGYGTNGSCLPLVSPSSAKMGGMFMPWTCSEVRAILPSGIALTTPGIDPQHLDTNQDGTACGPDD